MIHSSKRMAKLCKHAFACFVLFLMLSNCFAEEITAEAVYKLLSDSIFEMKIDIENINKRIQNMEETAVQGGMPTTVTPLAEATITEEELIDFKEKLEFNALAIQKTLSDEKVILRKTVQSFEYMFAELKSDFQKNIATLNYSLEIRAEEMFAIVHNSSIALANGIAELTADLSNTSDTMSQYLETMEIAMMTNFEDFETRIVANVTKIQNETLESLRSFQTVLEILSTNVSSVSSSLSNRISSEISSLSTRIDSVSSSLYSRISSETSSLSSRISSVSSSLSSSISSVSSSLSSRISSETSSLSSRISSVSSSLSSTSSSLSSSISSLSSRISKEEETKISFSAQMTAPDSYYMPNERINDFSNVVLNIGNAFDSSTGIFTAPRSGIYLFSVVVSSHDNDLLIVKIMQDYYQKGLAMAGDESHATGSLTVVSYLSVGDKVWVETSSYGEDKIYIRSHYTQFVGVQID